MSDEPKDFRYYADTAEEYLSSAAVAYSPRMADSYLEYAKIYAELAKAAPKAESHF